MAFFEAFQNPSKAHNGDFANGNIVLVKDGFCWPALFFTPFWLMFRGMWLVLILYIGVSLIFIGLSGAGYISAEASFWVQIGLSLLFAFEANFLRKWTMQRGNYRHIGVSLGSNLKQAEVNFFKQFSGENARSFEMETTPIAEESGHSSSQMVVNPVSNEKTTIHQKSHWKVGGKRKSDSVVGMFSDD